MGNFNRGNSHGGGGGHRNFGPKKFGGGNRFGGNAPGTKFEAVCAACGKACTVPFRPSGNRPTYCSECFQKQGGRDGGSRERSFDRPRFGDKRRPDFQPAGNHASSRDLDQMKAELILVHAKLDTILRVLQSERQSAPAVSEHAEDVIISPAPVVKKAPKKAKTKTKRIR